MVYGCCFTIVNTLINFLSILNDEAFSVGMHHLIELRIQAFIYFRNSSLLNHKKLWPAFFFRHAAPVLNHLPNWHYG